MSNTEFIYGYHAVKALLETQPKSIYRLYLQTEREDRRLQDLLNLAEKQSVVVQRLSRRELDQRLIEQVSHQGVLAECKGFDGFDESALVTLLENIHEPKLLLILDGIQDPHNLGACLRSANAFGVHAVIAPKDRAVGMTPVVRKVASGAAFVTPFVQVTNLARTMRWLQEQGVWIVGMAAESDKNLDEIELTGNIAMVSGSEGSGMRRLTREHCDFLARIPMQGTVESLNVSVATAVCLYEVQRQRKLKSR